MNQLRSTYPLAESKAEAHTKELFEQKADEVFASEIRQDVLTIKSNVKIAKATAAEHAKSMRTLAYFKQKYTPYPFVEKAQDFITEINDVFTVLVDERADGLMTWIQLHLKSSVMMEHFDLVYLDHVAPTTEKLQKLFELRESTKPLVRDFRREITESNAAARKNDAQLRKDKMAKVQQKAAQLNKDLQYKYLSFEALQEIYGAYSTLINARGEYMDSDFRSLVSRLNRYLFVRDGGGRLNTHEAFNGARDQKLFLRKEESGKVLTYRIPMTQTQTVELLLQEIYAKTKNTHRFNKQYDDSYDFKAESSVFLMTMN